MSDPKAESSASKMSVAKDSTSQQQPQPSKTADIQRKVEQQNNKKLDAGVQQPQKKAEPAKDELPKAQDKKALPEEVTGVIEVSDSTAISTAKPKVTEVKSAVPIQKSAKEDEAKKTEITSSQKKKDLIKEPKDVTMTPATSSKIPEQPKKVTMMDESSSSVNQKSKMEASVKKEIASTTSKVVVNLKNRQGSTAAISFSTRLADESKAVEMSVGGSAAARQKPEAAAKKILSKTEFVGSAVEKQHSDKMVVMNNNEEKDLRFIEFNSTIYQDLSQYGKDIAPLSSADPMVSLTTEGSKSGTLDDSESTLTRSQLAFWMKDRRLMCRGHQHPISKEQIKVLTQDDEDKTPISGYYIDHLQKFGKPPFRRPPRRL